VTICQITLDVRLDRHFALKWNRCPSTIDSYFA